VERERATILALASISQPIVQNEVYWPGVLTALTSATPTGGTITTFSASAVARVTAATPTSTVPTPPSAVQIASLSLALQASSGYPYFRSWYFSINGSGRLTVNGFTGISQVATKQIGYSATVGVTAEVTSIRANEFQVPR